MNCYVHHLVMLSILLLYEIDNYEK